jgi:hypothetical protein
MRSPPLLSDRDVVAVRVMGWLIPAGLVGVELSEFLLGAVEADMQARC